MNREGNRIEGLSEALGLFGMSGEECRLAEDFVSGQTDGEALSGFGVRDLSVVSDAAQERFEQVFKTVRKQRKKEVEGRLFTLLFALGEESCYPLVPEEIIKGERKLPGLAAEKRAAVYAAWIGTNSYSMGSYGLRSLLEAAGNEPEMLQRVLYCGQGKTANSRVILLALYFMTKYGKQVIAGENAEEIVAAEDAAMLRQYEEIVAGNFYVAHVMRALKKGGKAQTENTAGGSGVAAPLAGDTAGSEEPVRHAVAADTKGLPPELRLRTSDLEHLLCMTAGMAYLNFRLSDCLKELVRDSLAADPVRMLEIFLGISQELPMDIRLRGGAFDRELGLDREAYIYWAARKGLTEILEVQFQDNREDYLRVLERVESEYLQAQSKNDYQSWRVVQNAMEAENADKTILEAVEKHDPALYSSILAKRRQDGGRQELDQLITAVVPDFEDAGVIKAYLYGQEKAEALYPCLEHLQKQRDTKWMQNLLPKYLEKYPNEGFLRRCQVLMLLWHSSNSVIFLNDCISEEYGEEWRVVRPCLVEKLFRNFALEGVEVSRQLDGVICLCDLYDGMSREFLDGAEESFAGYLKEQREETLNAFAQAEAFGRFFGLRVMRREAEKNKAEILKYSQDTAKLVKQELLDILCNKRGWEKEVRALLSSKKAAERELAVRVLSVWQKAGADYGELLREAAGKEKNARVRELLRNVVVDHTAEGDAGAGTFSREALVKELHRGNAKRSLAWAYETPFSEVHFSAAQKADGAEQEKEAGAEQEKICGAAVPAADEEYLQAILLCYASNREAFASGKDAFASDKKEFTSRREKVASGGVEFASDREAFTSSREVFASGKEAAASGGEVSRAAVPAQRGRISKNAEFLASALNADELAVYVNELFDKWLAAGAESKKRWVLYAAALHGGAAIDEKLKQQIQEWPQCARGAIACEAVYALSLNPLPQALLAVDGIARNFRFRQVKAAANQALDFAAEQLNISREELADRVVPDFGFDGNMEKYFDYGTRAFLAVLTPELELEVFETAQVPEKDAGKAAARVKRLKTLPAPGRKDDAARATAAYEEFKQLKKQLKMTVTSQKQRLEYALWSAREWSVDAWKQLFIKNPVMHPFATGLIWGMYEDGRLVQSFRYMGDGSFGTADAEEYLPPAEGRIALVHPMELADEAKNTWRQQLSDYEIGQPVEQLNRTVFRVTPEEAGQRELARFQDRIINDIVLGRSLTKLGWNRGMVEDAGCFDTWYREDAELGLGVELDFSGSYVEGEDEDVTIYGARFYRVRRDKRGSLRYGAENEECVYALQDVPARYFSEAVRQLEKALR